MFIVNNGRNSIAFASCLFWAGEIREIMNQRLLLIWFTLFINSIMRSVAWFTSSSVCADVIRSEDAWGQENIKDIARLEFMYETRNFTSSMDLGPPTPVVEALHELIRGTVWGKEGGLLLATTVLADGLTNWVMIPPVDERLFVLKLLLVPKHNSINALQVHKTVEKQLIHDDEN